MPQPKMERPPHVRVRADGAGSTPIAQLAIYCMPGFEFRHQPSGTKDLAFADAELFTRGDMPAMTDAEVGPAAKVADVRTCGPREARRSVF